MRKVCIFLILSLLLATVLSSDRVFLKKRLMQEEQPAEQPVEQPVVELPVEEQPVEEQPAEQPVEEQPVEQPAEEQPVEQPAEEQPVEQPAEEQPVEEQPVEEQPVEEQPVEEQPVEEQPVEEQPVEEQPVEEQPTEEQPTEEQPTEEQPVEEQPVEEQPVEENPNNNNNNTITRDFDSLNATQFIKVIGRAHRNAKFNSAKIGFYVETLEQLAADSLRNNAQILNSTIDILKGLGLNETDISVSQMQVIPVFGLVLNDTNKNTEGALPVENAPEITSEQGSGDLATEEQPAAEQPAAEEPAAEEPAAEQPATEEPAAEQPATEEPAAEEPATEQPATEEPATEEPATEEPATEEPATEEPATEEPATEEPAAEEEEQPLYAFRVKNSFVVSINNTDLVGQIIDLVLKNGVKNIEYINYEPLEQDVEALREELLGEAIENAQKQARMIIDKLGYEMGPVRNINILDNHDESFEGLEYKANNRIEQEVEIEFGMRLKEEATAAEEPAAEQPAAEEPAAEQPAAEVPATEGGN